MEYNVATKNNVCEGFLLTEKFSQYIKWKNLDQNLFYIMLNIYWEEDVSKH